MIAYRIHMLCIFAINYQSGKGSKLVVGIRETKVVSPAKPNCFSNLLKPTKRNDVSITIYHSTPEGRHTVEAQNTIQVSVVIHK